MKTAKDWTYTSTHNGAFITIYAPDGRNCFLQGDDAALFLEREAQTSDSYTIADLCREYESVCTANPEGWDQVET